MNKNDYIDIEKLMKNRVSAKRFDPNHQIDDLTLGKLVESIRHSPSSMGLLNTRIVIFKNGEFKNDLVDAFYNQDNYREASAHIIFITDKPEIILEKTWPKTVENKFKENTFELKDAYHQKFVNLWNQRFDNGKDIEKIRCYLYNQVYIHLGVAIASAAVLDIDTCPHGGIDKKALDNYLHKNKIIGQDQEAVVALALGRLDKKNHILTSKTRLPKDEFKIEIID